MEEELCSLLTDFQVSVNLPRRNAILANGNQPNHRKPLVKAQRRIFEDRSGFDTELATWDAASCIATNAEPG
jgi:hypothetical protein